MSSNLEIDVSISESISSKHYEKIKWITQEIFTRLNVISTSRNHPINISISYGHLNHNTSKNSLHLNYDASMYDNSEVANYIYLNIDQLSEDISTGKIDPIGMAYRCLSLIDEKRIKPSRKDGNIALLDFSESERRQYQIPLVELISLAIGKLLFQAKILSSEPTVGFNNYKILLTHDSDASSHSNLLEIIYNITKGLVRFNPDFIKLAISGVRNYNKEYSADRYFSYANWLQGMPEFRHAFYLSLRGVAKSHIHDVRSSASQNSFPWEKLRDIGSEYRGRVEFGLHPSINVKKKQKHYINAKNMLEDNLNTPVFGLRHHYWSLNWKNRNQSYKRMINAGFKYDLSMCFYDTFGFRARTCLPFRPFDAVTNRPLDIYIIPTTIMDGWISDINFPDLKLHLSYLKSVNGVLNLDWHTESFQARFPFETHFSNLKKILEETESQGHFSELPINLVEQWHVNKKCCVDVNLRQNEK